MDPQNGANGTALKGLDLQIFVSSAGTAQTSIQSEATGST